LINTGTKENDILNLASKMAELSPGILKSVIDCLPEDRVYQKKVLLEIKNSLGNY
jgi:hypothetical protein